jgi:hypothetical protein
MITSGLRFKKIAKRTNFFLFHFIVPHTVAYIQITRTWFKENKQNTAYIQNTTGEDPPRCLDTT